MTAIYGLSLRFIRNGLCRLVDLVGLPSSIAGALGVVIGFLIAANVAHALHNHQMLMNPRLLVTLANSYVFI